jgi:hypothetical protein
MSRNGADMIKEADTPLVDDLNPGTTPDASKTACKRGTRKNSTRKTREKPTRKKSTRKKAPRPKTEVAASSLSKTGHIL